MSCLTCASFSAQYNLCASGEVAVMDNGLGCHSWSEIKEVKIKGVLPDGSIHELTSDELYDQYCIEEDYIVEDYWLVKNGEHWGLLAPTEDKWYICWTRELEFNSFLEACCWLQEEGISFK